MSECNHPEPSKGTGSPDYLTLLAERDSAIARAERAEGALEEIAAGEWIDSGWPRERAREALAGRGQRERGDGA